MKSVVITGCNRGIGLALIKHLSNKSQLNHIIATCRNPENAQVKNIAQHTKNLRSTKYMKIFTVYNCWSHYLYLII